MKTIKLLIAALFVAIVISACGNSPSVSISLEPSKENIVDAVLTSASGSYTTTETHTEWDTEQVTRTCTQMQVETDPYMPNNPELAKCLAVGATYTETQSVPREVRKTVSRPCPALPQAASAWSVIEVGNDEWQAAAGGGAWTVKLVMGGSVSAEVISVSGFSFLIDTTAVC